MISSRCSGSRPTSCRWRSSSTCACSCHTHSPSHALFFSTLYASTVSCLWPQARSSRSQQQCACARHPIQGGLAADGGQCACGGGAVRQHRARGQARPSHLSRHVPHILPAACHVAASLAVASHRPSRSACMHAIPSCLQVSTTRSVWDWAHRNCLEVFSNSNLPTTTITSLYFINDDTDSLVVARLSDGVVHIYQNCHQLASGASSDPVQMISAFCAMPSLISIKRGPGLILDWSQAASAFALEGTLGTLSSGMPPVRLKLMQVFLESTSHRFC